MGYKEDRIKAQEKLAAKQAVLEKAFKEAETGKDGEYDFMKSTSLEGKDNRERLDQVRKMNRELDDLDADVQRLADLERAEKRTKSREKDGVSTPLQAKDENKVEEKGIGDLFIETAAFKEYKGAGTGPTSEVPVSVKTLMQTSAGWAPQAIRTGVVIPFATRPIQVIDIVPMGNTNQNAIVYMEETTFTNNAAEAAEGTTYGEAALVLTERSVTVRKIGVWLPITDEQLEDIAQVQSYVNSRLTFMLRQRLDSQIINGDGVAPNLSGILANTGIQSSKKVGDIFDEMYKMLTKIRVTGQAVPNVFVAHPNDFQTIRLQRTNDGLYVLGNPSDVGPSRIWGLPVLEAQAQPIGTILAGDFANFLSLVEKRGIELNITDSHSDYFINGKKAIRADMRLALVNYRPSAFYKLTNV